MIWVWIKRLFKRPKKKRYITVSPEGAVTFHWDKLYKDHPEAFKREQEEIKKFFHKMKDKP